MPVPARHRPQSTANSSNSLRSTANSEPFCYSCLGFFFVRRAYRFLFLNEPFICLFIFGLKNRVVSCVQAV